MHIALKQLLRQCALLAAAAALVLAGALVALGDSRTALGVIFGVCIGMVNLALLAVRVTQVGNIANPRAGRRLMLASMGMRLLIIGLSAAIAIRISETMNVYGLLVGLLLTIVVANVLGARYFLRSVY